VAERQTLERFDPNRDFGIVAVGSDWHPGVIGIVASRLVARFHRPVVVITTQRDGRTRGSCRSIQGFSLVDALADCAETLLRHGGHAMAAGLELAPDRIEAFRQRFEEVAALRLRGVLLQPTLQVDAWLNLSEVDDSLLDAVEAMRPFGTGNPAPVWAASRLTLVGQPRIVGDRHLKMTLADGGRSCEAMAFRMADREIPRGPIDAAFTLNRNEWRGRKTIQLFLQDFRPAQSESDPAPFTG
ncbi:MAG: DHHA1 domain-containing protein, partial [Kiritimatiellia bacterium]|nr:DHHA1 domain-containing protein [Kiritimatiellia bacterium]